MAARPTKGGAPALPIARAFLDVGGRLMLNPHGKLETGGGLRWSLPEISAREARKSFVVERRLARRLRNRSFRLSVSALVVQEGVRTENGWLVMGALS